MTLDKLKPGQTCEVVEYIEDTLITRRLMEMGLMPGVEVTYLRNAPLQDPLEIQVGSSCLSLRQKEASIITVELIED